jgi:lipopolysaccharide export system permease protein
MANNTEIVAIISSGASFHRFSKPYLYTSILLALIALWCIIWYLREYQEKMKWKLTLIMQPIKKRSGTAPASSQLSKTEYIFVDSWNKRKKRIQLCV